jgi:predicted flap endonuclease-1-like 5' DNA nuclease
MTYKLEEIEGIGPFFAQRLAAAGVHDSDELLKRCATDEGRRQIASYAAVGTQQLETWMHQADLMRVSGIGGAFGRLLEASGVQSVEALSRREPENVVNLLHRVNEEQRIARAVPSLKTVSKWVRRARELQPLESRAIGSASMGSASMGSASMGAHAGARTVSASPLVPDATGDSRASGESEMVGSNPARPRPWS